MVGLHQWLLRTVLLLAAVGILHVLLSRCAISLPVRDQEGANEDIERSFGSCLVLMPREHAGVVIGSSIVSDSFIGFTYSLVAKVFMDQTVNLDGFIKTMSQSRK